MNTPKYNIEQQIKKQIDEREVSPTRDLWTEIENQTSRQATSKSKVSWFLVAACFILLATLSVVLIFNKKEVIEPQIVKTEIQPQNIKLDKNVEKEISPILTQKTELVATKNTRIQPSQKIEISKLEVVVAKLETPAKGTQKQITSEIYKDQSSNQNILAKIDSTHVPKKRKKYVDASTLLFSVEHKEVIENSKDGRNVATIDLNSK
ncbi:hypothetical protein [Kaistella jeonii]|uniref:Uncharacterized protein n=1 Tax=Kaistella jeonii TaxID=266749 RepID=A0A0C1D653_9FLAO|nr:hypothetical protein [Kaistella jeonii]KIA89275.1 hypothetical protein OA86_06655 [Kaistella jeonii]SFC01673.1 hypothetical protein SAMN05421876_10552 [Kaistella jeonii]VEI96586.1 Uncharacterised protein [Kaistella jeonii]